MIFKMQANMLRRYEKAFWCFCFVFFLLGVRQYNIQSIQNRVLLIGLKKKKPEHSFCGIYSATKTNLYNIAFRKVFYTDKRSWEHFHYMFLSFSWMVLGHVVNSLCYCNMQGSFFPWGAFYPLNTISRINNNCCLLV